MCESLAMDIRIIVLWSWHCGTTPSTLAMFVELPLLPHPVVKFTSNFLIFVHLIFLLHISNLWDSNRVTIPISFITEFILYSNPGLSFSHISTITI